MNLLLKRKFVAGAALIAFAGFFVVRSHAQTAPVATTASDDDKVKLEKFEVTGSRLSPPDFAGALPVTSYGSLEISKGTAVSINNFLRFNPTTFGAGNFDEGTVNGGDGRAQIGLRGLPTLLLVNGKRQATNDLNAIPLAAVDHIEVLKDGNGTVYGADAVGGVINIITKRRFEGVQIDGFYQNTTENEISRRRASAVFGQASERGSLTVGIEYFQQNDMFSKDRNELTNTLDRSFGATSATPNPGKFNLTAAQALAMFGVTNTGTVSYRVKNSVTAATAPGDFRVGQYGNVPPEQSDRFPFAIYTPTVRPSDRYNVFASSDYQLIKNSDVAKLYTDIFYMRNVSHSGLAPSPASFRNNSADGNFTIKKDYYWNQKVFGANATDITSWDYRFLDLGPRDDKVTFTNFAFTAGVKGDITDRISYDVNYKWNRDEQLDEELHGVNRINLLKVLQGTSPYSGAQLFNPFTNPFDSGKVTNDPEMLRYLDFTPRTTRTTTTRVGDAIIHFKPFELPAGTVEAVAGYEQRWEDFIRDPDYAKQNATGSGWNGTSFFEQHYVIKSYFGEAVVPLLSNLQFVKKLQLGAAVRHETYSHFDSKPTIYRVYLRDQVTSDLTARISYSEGFTIPTPSQLDPTAVQNFPEVFMPWLGVADQTNQGVILSGNPKLSPTTSKSYNLGVVWSPKAVKGLEVAADVYQIEQKNIIIQDPQLYVDAFAAGGGITKNANGTFTKNNSAPYASIIDVDTDGAVTGIPGYIIQITDVKNENLASLKATAVDLDTTYRWDTASFGAFAARVNVTYTSKFDIDKIPGKLPTTHYAGYFTPNDGISPGTVPHWKGSTSLEWMFRNFDTLVRLNYTGSFKEDPNGGSDFTSSVKAWPTFDLTVGYTLAKTGTSIRVGVENAFNKLPPTAVSSFADKYDRSSHNILRRLVSVSLNQKF